MKWRVRSIRGTMWGVYWKFHGEREQLVTRLKEYLDGLPPEICRRIMLGILIAFTVLALYTFGRAICDIGRNDGSRTEAGHAGWVELSTPAEADNYLAPYLYGADEE